MKRSVRILVCLLFPVFASGCVPISLPVLLDFLLSEAPNPSTLTVTIDDAQVVFPLHGGIKARLSADPSRLLSTSGVQVQITVEQLSIAGDSVTIVQPGVTAVTGTTCAAENPADPSTGTALVKFNQLTMLPTLATADFRFSTLATNDLIARLVTAGQVALVGTVMNAPVHFDLAKILAGQADHAITAPVTIAGNLPAEVPLLGGAPFVLKSTLESSATPSTHPLLAACAAFYAKVRGQVPPTPANTSTPTGVIVPTATRPPVPTNTLPPVPTNTFTPASTVTPPPTIVASPTPPSTAVASPTPPSTATASPTPPPTAAATSTATATATPAGVSHDCTFGSGTQVTLNDGGVVVTINLTGHQEMDFSATDATGLRTIFLPRTGTHVDCAKLPLNSGVACVRPDPTQDGFGRIDCTGTAGTTNYNVATEQDHNSNNGNDAGFDNDPTCTATFTNPDGSVTQAVLEDGSGAHPHTGVCNSPIHAAASGTFPAGGMQLSERLILRTISTITSCTPNPCPPDTTPFDATMGDQPFSIIIGTGTASSKIDDLNNVQGDTLSGNISGTVQPCADIDAGSLSAGGIVGAFPGLDLAVLSDSVVTFKIKCQ